MEEVEGLVSDEQGERVEPVVENIGKEFFEWADKYWSLNVFITKGIEVVGKREDSEVCLYEIMKTYFIKKINELAEQKYAKPEPNKELLTELCDYIGTHIYKIGRIAPEDIPVQSNSELVEEFLKTRK
jgi:hypothetical protein